jgi:hypothetical protein
LTDIWASPTYQVYLNDIVMRKASLTILQTFLRAIPANILVCLAIFMGLVARDVIGKVTGMWWPIFAFAVIGYEHCVANMFLISTGLMFGAKITAGQFALNIVFVVLGNSLGGALFVGFSEFFLYHWRHEDVHLHARVVKIGLGLAVDLHDPKREELRKLRERWEKICENCCCCWNNLFCCLGKRRNVDKNKVDPGAVVSTAETTTTEVVISPPEP